MRVSKHLQLMPAFICSENTHDFSSGAYILQLSSDEYRVRRDFIYGCYLYTFVFQYAAVSIVAFPFGKVHKLEPIMKRLCIQTMPLQGDPLISSTLYG